jgi:hypothetical protein
MTERRDDGEERRNRARTGPAIVLAGAVLLTVGVVGGGAGAGGSGAPSTTTAPLAATTVSSAAPSDSTTTIGSETPATAGTPSTATGDPTTTSTPPPEEAIPTAVIRYASAIDAGDVDGLLATLHPGVVRLYGEAACRAFVETRILPLEGYRLAGDIRDGAPATLRTDEGTVTVAALYVVPVAFRIGNEDFEVDAQFAVEDGSVYWIGRCS